MVENKKFLPMQHSIDGYGAGGFRFAGMSHKGAILCLPSGISAWNGVDFNAAFYEADKIDMFLWGTGKTLMPVSNNIKLLFKEYKISLDAMPTAAAARTYNVLLSEGRRVACGLIAVD